MFEVKTILHPTDLNELSNNAFRAACALAREKKANLIVLHIAPRGVVSYVDRVSELSAEEAKQKLWEAVRWPREEEAGVNVTHRLEEGDPVREILRVARETHSDLIMMGTHGRRGLTRWFSGSVAEEVVRKAPCSVLIVKPPVEAVQAEPVLASEQQATKPD
jgi:nucleotide-binding universal stress UspA family protein